jgi:hypothetical protein
MHQWVKGIAVMFTVTAAIGCGGSSGGSPTSLPPSTKLMTLTPAQQMQICTDLTNYSVKNISQANVCKFAGITVAALVLASDPSTPDSSLREACSQAVTQCNSTPPDTSGSTCDFSGVETCSADATIADFNACAKDGVAAENAAFAALPACSAISASYLSSTSDPTTNIPEPPSCVSLDAKCPGVSM